VSSSIVLIGPADALPGLQARLDPGAEVQSFTESEALEALDYIIRTKPGLIALQDDFSATSRGMALINRIKDDPNLSSCEVRVLARDAAQNRVAVKRTGQGAGPPGQDHRAASAGAASLIAVPGPWPGSTRSPHPR